MVCNGMQLQKQLKYLNYIGILTIFNAA